MTSVYSHIFTEEEINYLCNLPEVLEAKKKLDSKQKIIYFHISLSESMKQKIKENIQLDLFHIDSIPMRWIQGDTKPHIDRGISSFKKTYLIYLNDNPGQFIIDGNSYTMNKGNGYVFDEGLSHETIGTGLEPRLLLGPMSEFGLGVGAGSVIFADGQTETIYFKYFTGPSIFGTQYKINNGSYNNLSLPVTIVNTNTSYTLKVLFENNIVIDSNIWYMICGSHNIQFGSESLNSDGSRPILTVDTVLNYPGFINNGSNSAEGFDNIKIYNLQITTSGGSTLQSDGGWFGQSYFGRLKINNYIINCSSDGPIIDAGGGIIGGYAGEAGTLYIFGCSSSGNTGQYSGGIIGFYAGQNAGSITCEYCWSEGSIGIDSGGIIGYYPGYSGGFTYANYCYSLGYIGTNAGGIYGAYAGENIARNYATGCYSTGNINTDGGGIFGSNAGVGGGTVSAINCYSNGVITTTGNGIYGTNNISGTETNCYSSNGSWNSTTANLNLTGVPTSVVGTTWVSTVTNQPYELVNMGYTPYTVTNILTTTTPQLKKSYQSSLKQNQNTISGIISGLSYEILQKSGGNSSSYNTITINSTTGVISTTSSTKPGTYTLYIRNTGSYYITQYTLIVQKKNQKNKKKVHVFYDNVNGTTLVVNQKCKKKLVYWCP